MDNRDVRISISELLDIVGYYENKDFAEKLKKHFYKYGDYARIKDMVIKSAVMKNLERVKMQDNIKSLMKKILKQTQIEAFPEIAGSDKGKL